MESCSAWSVWSPGPNMDNINHHPKNVVDSIWHALEKEWEFEGFAHKAREMFKKSATKYMRNKKMQLKYKCHKNVGGRKPDDVSDTHWKKIVQLTKNSMKQHGAGSSRQTASEGKTQDFEDDMETKQFLLQECAQKASEEEEENSNCRKRKELVTGESEEEMLTLGLLETLGCNDDSLRRSGKFPLLAGESLASEGEDVESQITSLRRQLLWLQNSKKPCMKRNDDVTEVGLHLTTEKGTASEVQRVVEASKENVAPSPAFVNKESTKNNQGTGKPKHKMVQVDSCLLKSKNNPAAEKEAGLQGDLLERVCDMNTNEGEKMECGDVISMATIIRGKEQDIGKGILMGFAGSKFARKVIPKGWCSIKVNSCTPTGGSEPCPIPCGWKDQGRYKTVRDAEGCIILWPDSLVHV